ncbi:MAG: NADP-dependent oxidoreductase [Bacillota bacterium]
MRAWQLDDSAARVLLTEDVPQPKPGPGDVLVRVQAAGITSTELSWYPTLHTKTGEKRHHAIPGHEFAGTVAAVGPKTSGVGVGHEIYGMNDWFADGATADYCLTRPEWIAPKPRRLSYAEAASVPIGALTAWQGLFDRAHLQAGERVLIHGGSGGVGSFAVQFARRHGAHVITTASARNEEFLLHVGAEQVVDYRTARFEESIAAIDVVFDTVGGDTLQRSWGVLKPTGRLVTVAASSEGATDQRTKNAYFIVEPNQTQLSMIGNLLDTGEIQPVVDAVVPFAQAGAAYARKIQQRLGRGKVVIAVTE